MQRKGKIAVIDWHDSCQDSGWMPKRQARKHTISQCRTVGILLRKTKREIIVYQSRSDTTDNVTETMAIPLSDIENLIYLDEPKVND